MLKSHCIKIMFIILTTFTFISCGGNKDSAKNIAINKLIAYANSQGTSETPTLQDYIDAGVVGMTEARLVEMNEIVSNLTEEEVDTREEVQALVNELGVVIPKDTVASPKPKVTTSTSTSTSNTAPIAKTQDIVVDEDSVSNTIVLEGSDVDNDVLSYSIVSTTTQGTLTLSGSTALYTPNSNYQGTDSFNFKVNDGILDSIIGIVTITVTNLTEPLLLRKIGIAGYPSTCDDYQKQSGEDINNNGILDDNEVTKSIEVHPQGLPLTRSQLEIKIVNDDDITGVNTCKITDMSNLFNNNTTFNQNIGNWNTGAVTSMVRMFLEASTFNQDIGNWNTANVIDMEAMFLFSSSFNQDIGNWNTGVVKSMYATFLGASTFNQNIGNWNTAKVTNMEQMFLLATVFNQNISGWTVSQVTNHINFSDNSVLTLENSPKF